GGLWYGSRTWTIPLWRRYTVLLAVYAGCVLPLLTGFGSAGMFAMAVITGLALSPVTICEFGLVGRCAPATTIAEAFAWATTATFAGNALGTGLAGVLVEQVDWRAALGAAALVLTVAAVATAWRRDLFRPAEPSTHSALSTDTG
ncbi:MAG: MFS transporter, partial [Sciscionella sp.]